uniref:Peroxisomal 2,4-dienoyl-CoA reductase [(3E)-enoyl-CoA-producing] n=1 Tax=Oncorhynchus tshawytscha TaxID=74940 RepID=A0AAZ3Q1T1_ONCTS
MFFDFLSSFIFFLFENVSKCLALNFIDVVGNFLCPATSLSLNGFKTVLEIYIMGMFNRPWGAIVNNSATRGYTDLQVHAGSAKAANGKNMTVSCVAVEWGPSGVRVNTLAPGPISGTEGFCRLGGNRAESMDAFSSIPPQRVGNKMELDGGSWLTSANDISMLLGIASSQSAKLLTRPLPHHRCVGQKRKWRCRSRRGGRCEVVLSRKIGGKHSNISKKILT